MKKQWNDQTAIDDIRAGKQEGATYLFKQYGGKLLGFFQKSFRLSKADAEEVLQNTFIRFINQVCKKTPENVSAYLFTIGRNECLRFLKKNYPDEKDNENDDNIDNIPSDVDLEREFSLQDCIAKALKRFEKGVKNADKCLQILTLKAENGSIKEIANKIGRTNGATREFLSQCRKKIKPYLQPCRDDGKK
jgi:RNA polymerase sigma-70 factor (ECF subfamily)